MEKRAITRISGYYNGEKWPIQIVISKLNITLRLEPGDFIRDSSGQKINDSFFEPFANSGNLSRELADAPVPMNGLDKRWPMGA